MLEYGHVLRGHLRVSDVDTVKLLLEGALSARASFGAAEVMEVSVAWLCVFSGGYRLPRLLLGVRGR
jgi:hypothetical protein